MKTKAKRDHLTACSTCNQGVISALYQVVLQRKFKKNASFGNIIPALELPARLPGVLLYLVCLTSISCTHLATSKYSDTFMSRADGQSLDLSIYHPGVSAHRLSERQQITRIIESRSSPRLEQTLLGALIFLSDTQIRDREGIHSSLYDYCHTEKTTCRGVVLLNRRGGREYRQKTPKFNEFSIENIIGEWATTVHFLPDRFGDREGESKVTIQDSSVFPTVAILYPLYYIDEQMLPPKERFVTATRSLAANSMAQYKRGDAYNFWKEKAGETSIHAKTGPFNIPVKFSQTMGNLVIGRFHRLWQRLTAGMDVGGEAWVQRVLDEDENPYGFDAVFNIPNDADDTSTVVATQKYHRFYHSAERIKPDLSALRVITRYRDKDRRKMDKRDQWRGEQESGAFLTWLKDEDLPTFSSPEAGILTHGVNNIDCVVNANVLFSFSLNGVQNWNGFDDAKRLLARAVNEKLWIVNKCGLYYPQFMMFPYTVSRAFREGALFDDLILGSAMRVLLQDLLAMQSDNGSFPGGKDRSDHLSTALAVSSLLNIGAETARKLKLMDRYQESLANGIRYLVEARTPHQVLFADTFSLNQSTPNTRYGYKWQSGLFFSTSFWDLAHWRSEGYTAAIVIEALTKYMLAFDMDRSTLLQGRRLKIDAYDNSVQQEPKHSRFSVKVGW